MGGQLREMVPIGTGALNNLSSGSSSHQGSVAVGYRAMWAQSDCGYHHVAIGLCARCGSYGNTNYGVAVGARAGINNINGSWDVAIGASALQGSGNTTTNTAVGACAGGVSPYQTNSQQNVFVGYWAGKQARTGCSTFLGANTLNNSTVNCYSNSTAVGYQASISASNMMIFGNASISCFKIQSQSAKIDFRICALTSLP